MLSKTVRLNDDERKMLSHSMRLMDEQQNFPPDCPLSPPEWARLYNKVKLTEEQAWPED